MGLGVGLNIQPDRIDAERWEAVWLTSLQLLDRFPGPLAAHVVDERHQCRHVLTPRLLFQRGTRDEHWKVDGDLASGRMGESYYLYRHLTHYHQTARPARHSEPGTDILQPPGNEPPDAELAGVWMFNAKSQGFPYHYAMLAVATLVENAFPEHALAHGDISRTQAEQIVPWVEAILGRSLSLPVVTDAGRLWRRLAQVYAGEPERAVRRFLTLYAEQLGSSWRTLLQLQDGPDNAVLCRAYRSELAHYTSLRQRGAAELIAALCDASGGIYRMLDWVCGSSHADETCRFAPVEMLECLCDILVPIPPEERDVLDALTPPADHLPTIETIFFRVFSRLIGKPVACDLYVDEETIAAEFAARWPQQADRLRELLQQRTAVTRDKLAEARVLLDQRLTAMDRAEHEGTGEGFSPAMDVDVADQPAGTFIDAEMARQRPKRVANREFAWQLGEEMRAGVATNHDFRQKLDACGRKELLQQIARASHKNGFALREVAWEKLEESTMDELYCLTMLALLPVSESQFCAARVQLLETPDLWPALAGKE
jgi:hypothetical protein